MSNTSQYPNAHLYEQLNPNDEVKEPVSQSVLEGLNQTALRVLLEGGTIDLNLAYFFRITEELLFLRQQANRPPLAIDVSFGFNWNDVASGENLDRVLNEIKTRLAGVEDNYVIMPPSFEDAEVGIWNYETVYAALRYLADYNPVLLQNLVCSEAGWSMLWHESDNPTKLMDVGTDTEIALCIIKAAAWAEANGDPGKNRKIALKPFPKRYVVGFDPAAREGSDTDAYHE